MKWIGARDLLAKSERIQDDHDSTGIVNDRRGKWRELPKGGDDEVPGVDSHCCGKILIDGFESFLRNIECLRYQ